MCQFIGTNYVVLDVERMKTDLVESHEMGQAFSPYRLEVDWTQGSFLCSATAQHKNVTIGLDSVTPFGAWLK
ncbi:hypothetical protein OAT16_06665 [Prolixibacteraceae bacterium]|nr:hypothetical protein [Prolixibacteraceae bacterium]